MVSTKGSCAFSLRVKDKFGDYGLVSVVLAVPATEGDTTKLVIDTWVMSCRVIGRTIEEFTFRYLVSVAEKAGYQQIVGEYIPTAKNELVRDLYPKLGFEPSAPVTAGGCLFTLRVEKASLPITFVSAPATRRAA